VSEGFPSRGFNGKLKMENGELGVRESLSGGFLSARVDWVLIDN